MEQVILNGINLNDFFDRLETRMSGLMKLVSKPEFPDDVRETYFTRKEAAAMMRISLPTLNELTKKGTIKSYRLGTRILYEKEALKEALTERNFEASLRKARRDGA